MFLVLLQGGVPGWQVLCHPLPDQQSVNGIAVPRNALFGRKTGSLERAAEFSTREAADVAIAATELYYSLQRAAGHTGFEPISSHGRFVIVEVPSETGETGGSRTRDVA